MSSNRKPIENDSFAAQLEEKLVSHLFKEAGSALDNANNAVASLTFKNIAEHYRNSIANKNSFSFHLLTNAEEALKQNNLHLANVYLLFIKQLNDIKIKNSTFSSPDIEKSNIEKSRSCANLNFYGLKMKDVFYLSPTSTNTPVEKDDIQQHRSLTCKV